MLEKFKPGLPSASTLALLSGLASALRASRSAFFSSIQAFTLLEEEKNQKIKQKSKFFKM